jgi:Pyruvate/2-oxoacid:ferredoxin oxidoreductase gamma subunit
MVFSTRQPEAPVERELMVTGIGGQGVQLAARVVAGAALLEGREVQLFGSYGGMMRGGETEATVIVGDGPIEAPPTIGRTWSAIVMHHEYWQPTQRRLVPGSVVLLNSTVFAEPLDRDAFVVVDVPASATAADLGNVMAASMVMAGAYAAATELVGLPALEEAVGEALPSYRRQHRELNVRALQAGFELAPRRIAPAWEVAVS